MRQKCEYNPVCDVQQVSPEGALDLAKAYSLGSIPSNLTSDVADFNNIDDPATIAGKPDDVFSGMQAGKVVESRGKKSAESE